MSTLQNIDTHNSTVEERLSHVGAKIDQLIIRANKAKQAIQQKEEKARKRGEAALDEIKAGLDNAWHELNQAWNEVRQSGKRAASKLRSDEHACCHQTKAEDESGSRV